MYNGKYNHRRRRSRWVKKAVILCAIAVMTFGLVGGTLAYLFTTTEDVSNTFTPPEIGVVINESFVNDQDVVKENVTITNTCEFPGYIRAAYVAYFENNGKIHPTVPVLDEDLGSNWTDKQDGWYLYNSVVPAEGTTENFINSLKLADGQIIPEGYKLVVDVLAEVVQERPAQAINDIWGY